MCVNGRAGRLIYCRYNVGGKWEMNGRGRREMIPGIQFSKAFTRADTRFARANNSLDELVERVARTARAKSSLFGFARAKSHSLERTPLWKPSLEQIWNRSSEPEPVTYGLLTPSMGELPP